MPAVYFPIHATYKTFQTNFKPPVPARSAGCCLVLYIEIVISDIYLFSDVTEATISWVQNKNK